MTLQELIEEHYEGLFDLGAVYSVVFVTNEISTDAEVVRGIATENLQTTEVQADYFSDINQSVLEYENIPDFVVKESLATSTALRQFIVNWPEQVTLIGSNVNKWLEPLVKSLDDDYDLFRGRQLDIVDLGAFASVGKPSMVRRGDRLSKVLPPSRFNSRSGALHRLCELVGVYKYQIHEPIYAQQRARMLAEATRRFLDKEIEEPKD